MSAPAMTKEDVLAVLDRDSEQAWQYRDLQDGDIDESERLSEESKQARATVEALWEERDEAQVAARAIEAECREAWKQAAHWRGEATRAEAALKEAGWRPISAIGDEKPGRFLVFRPAYPNNSVGEDVWDGADWRIHFAEDITHFHLLPTPPQQGAGT